MDRTIRKGRRQRRAGETPLGSRYPFGLPRTDNVNYLWIQLFCSELQERSARDAGGRAGVVMANSAATVNPCHMNLAVHELNSGFERRQSLENAINFAN